MPKLRGLKVSVLVDGKALKEYHVKLIKAKTPAEDVLECYIASEPGKVRGRPVSHIRER